MEFYRPPPPSFFFHARPVGGITTCSAGGRRGTVNECDRVAFAQAAAKEKSSAIKLQSAWRGSEARKLLPWLVRLTWERRFDAQARRLFYVSHLSGASQWAPPRLPRPKRKRARGAASGKGGPTTLYNLVGGAAELVPKPLRWQDAVHEPDGELYTHSFDSACVRRRPPRDVDGLQTTVVTLDRAGSTRAIYMFATTVTRFPFE